MLRINKLADYATVIMSHMARRPEQTHSAARIAGDLHIAQPTVSKILKLLAHGNLLLAQRGANGGYTLGRAPEKISIAEVINAIEGMPPGLTECSSMPGVCAQEPCCAIRGNWQRISVAIMRGLEMVTLADMAVPQSVSATIMSFASAKRPAAGAQGRGALAAAGGRR
ncbi:MAG: SUF system Fe-S cluster assembly regulator [Betaproteobacteria bacterium]|nr:SUF system Fe-S cluster assembly regulator [Betaproteobacteria bacterium]